MLKELVLLTRNLLAHWRLGAFVLGASLPASVLHCDNMSVITQLHKRDLSARARHVRTNLGFVYDAIDDRDIAVQHVRTVKNPANTLTTAENRDRFRASRTVLSDHTAYTRVYKQRLRSREKFYKQLQPTCAIRTTFTAGEHNIPSRSHTTGHQFTHNRSRLPTEDRHNPEKDFSPHGDSRQRTSFNCREFQLANIFFLAKHDFS